MYLRSGMLVGMPIDTCAAMLGKHVRGMRAYMFVDTRAGIGVDVRVGMRVDLNAGFGVDM